MNEGPKVLLVSKPLVPPWNDSSKNLAKDVALGVQRYQPVVLSDGSGWRPPRGVVEPVYRGAGGFAPSITTQLRVLARLAIGGRVALWHFFFAPNPKSSAAGAALSRLRRVPTVQTVCSRPRDLGRARRLLFADRTVVLSRQTYDALADAGVRPERMVHIPPAVPPLEPLSEQERRAARAAFELDPDTSVVVFPGDLELGDGAARILEAYARRDRADGVLVMACRAKTAGAAAAERRLRARAEDLGIEHSVRWVGETRRIHELLGCADVIALPSSDLYAKMDLPLVLIEAMWLGRPVLVASDAAARELADGGAAKAVEPNVDALAAALDELSEGDARAELGRSARLAAKERYHPGRMVTAYEDLYDEVLEGAR